MTKQFLFPLLCSSLVFFSAIADEHLDSGARQKGLTFYCSFDRNWDADYAAGSAKGKLIGDAKGVSVPGLKNNALLTGADANGENRRCVQFQAVKNIDAKQGTLLCWFQPKDWQKFQACFQHLVSCKGGSAFHCYQNGRGKVGIYEGKNGKGRLAVTPVTQWQDGEWHHLGAVWTPEAWTLYIDGSCAGSFSRNADWSSQPWRVLNVGMLGWNKKLIHGMTVIDELKIFNRPLSANEIAEAYGELGGNLQNSSERFLLRVGKSTATMDGRIEHGEYAASGSGFQTLQGAFSPVQPVWHFGFDDRYLYAAMESQISSAPVAKAALRDGAVYADDSVELDLLGANETICQIVVNTDKVVYDSRIQKQHHPEWNLNGLKVGSSIENGVWTLEMAIPLAELGKPRKDGSWGLNFSRAILGGNAVSRGLSLAPVRKNFLDTSRFIEFIPDASAPHFDIRYLGDLNAGMVKLAAKVPPETRVRTAYATNERLWTDEVLKVKDGRAEYSAKVMPNGKLTTEIAQGEKPLYRAVLTGRAPSPVTVQYIYTDTAKQQLHIVLKNEAAQTGGAVVAQFKDCKNGKVKAEKRLPVANTAIFFEELWDVSPLPPGDYDFVCTAYRADGKAQGEPFIQIFRKPGAPEVWRDNQFGIYPGEVPPPWVPIRSGENRIDMLMQSYRFTDSMLPSWFGTHKENLFTRPAELIVNGKAVRNANFRIVKAAPDVVTAQTTGTADGLNLVIDYRFEYDGMIWLKLTLNGKDFPLKTLTMEFPLRREEGHLVHGCTRADTHTASFGRNGKLDESLWHKNLYASPMFWAGGDHLGLCWFAENLKNWRNEKIDNSVEIVPNGSKERLVRLTLIDHPVTVNGDYCFEFGLQGSPVKPAPNRNYIRAWNNYGDSASCYFDYHDPDPEFFDRKKFERQWKQIRDQKLPYFCYTSSNGMSPYAPEWAWYGREWISKQIGVYMIETQIRNLRERNKNVWTYACLNCKSFFDFKTWMTARLITSPEYHLEHSYFDLVGPRLCDNAKHGCGWRDSKGNLWPSLNILSVREFHKRMYHLSKKKSPEYLHVLHITGRSKVLPVTAFADAAVDGETFYGGEVVEKENYYGVFTPEMFRACYQTSETGYDMVFIPQLVRAAKMQRPDRVKLWTSDPPAPEMLRALRHFIGYALVHNVFIWYWDPWTRKTVNRLKAEEEKHFGTLRDLRFISYWEPQKPYTVQSDVPERTMVSVLKHQDRAVMFLFNDTAKDQRITVNIDVRKLLGSAGMLVRDFEPEYPSRVSGNTLSVSVPARFCLIVFLAPDGTKAAH